MGAMTQQQVAARPAGTSALIYGVLSLIALALAAIGQAAGWGSPAALLLAAIATLGGLATGAVKRLAGGEQGSPNVGRLAWFALVPPAALLLLGLLVG